MTFRLLQNFKGGRALVITRRAGWETTLETTLAKLGVACDYPEIVDGRAQLDVGVLQPERDILFIDGDLEGAVAIEVNPASKLPPVPVIGLVGVEAPSRLKALVNLGATSFLRKPVHGGAVYTALFLGINQFLLRTDMYEKLQDLESRRRGRRAVIRAVVTLMQETGLNDDDAYSALRRDSMRARQSLELYCEEFLKRRARPPDTPERPSSITLQGVNKQAMQEHHMTRSGLRGLRAAALTGTLVFASGAYAAENPIKLGVLEDQSGDFAAATIGKVHAIQLAAEEINKSGGIMGRPLELVTYDTQSDNTRYQEFMRRVLQRDKVDVVFAGFSSASREAYRPIVDQFNGFAFYNNQYEGGVCDGHMVVTGAVPEQQFSTLIPYMMQTYGKKVYTLAADYNFGQISAEWVRKIVKENGGEMAGEEFIPLGVSQFSQSIQNIQKAKPDFVVTLLVGTAQASYYEQAASANVNLPMASSVNVGQGYEHKRFKPPSLKDMYVTTNYIEEIDTPKSKEFYAKFKAKFPSEPYVNQEAENSYLAVYLYKQMVERAKSTNRDEIRKVIATGDVCMDAPEGKVCIDPKSQHMSHTIYLAKVGADHSISFPKIWEDIKPYWLGEAGCDLTKKDPMAQYTPSNPPPKP